MNYLSLLILVLAHKIFALPDWVGRIVTLRDHGGAGVSDHSVQVDRTGYHFTDHTISTNR
jgi:hypothetical protein